MRKAPSGEPKYQVNEDVLVAKAESSFLGKIGRIINIKTCFGKKDKPLNRYLVQFCDGTFTVNFDEPDLKKAKR